MGVGVVGTGRGLVLQDSRECLNLRVVMMTAWKWIGCGMLEGIGRGIGTCGRGLQRTRGADAVLGRVEPRGREGTRKRSSAMCVVKDLGAVKKEPAIRRAGARVPTSWLE